MKLNSLTALASVRSLFDNNPCLPATPVTKRPARRVEYRAATRQDFIPHYRKLSDVIASVHAAGAERNGRNPLQAVPLKPNLYRPTDLFIDQETCHHSQHLLVVELDGGITKVKCLDCNSFVKPGHVYADHTFVRRYLKDIAPRDMNPAHRNAYRAALRHTHEAIND